jgi:hypothetical protein
VSSILTIEHILICFEDVFVHAFRGCVPHVVHLMSCHELVLVLHCICKSCILSYHVCIFFLFFASHYVGCASLCPIQPSIALEFDICIFFPNKRVLIFHMS